MPEIESATLKKVSEVLPSYGNYGNPLDVTAGFAPALNNLNAAIASRHQASQVNGTNFKVFGDGNSFLGDRRVQNSGDGQLLSGF